jgi:hypothetical protein
MALLPVFHVIASQFPIATASATDIPSGRIVTLTSAGQVDLANAVSNTTAFPIGIAGDSRSSGTTSYSVASGSSLNQQQGFTKGTDNDGALIMGAYGDSVRFTQNRVADNYNEVLASGKMTVYHSGGEFWTDQYEVTTDTGAIATTFTPGGPVFTSKGTTAANRGLVTDETTNEGATGAGYLVGYTLTSPTGYPSGVPGTGPNAVGFSALPEGGNSLSWGNMLHFKLAL